MIQNALTYITSDQLADQVLAELANYEAEEDKKAFIEGLINMTYDAGIQSAQNYDCFGCEEIDSCSYSYESEQCPQK